MIVDDQHRQLHDAAQELVLSVNDFYFLMLPPTVKERLQDLAMYCGCSHVSWFSHKVRVEDEKP